MTCSFENDEVKTTAPLKAGNTEMFLSIAMHCILARRFTRQQDFSQKMLSDFFAVVLWPSQGRAVNKTGCGSRDNVKQKILLIPLRFPSEYVAVKNIAKNTRDLKVKSVLLLKKSSFPRMLN